jgi:transposase-like protein/IS1 family transposase
MIALCQHDHLTKHGKDRHGRRRWKCRSCGVTVTREHTRPLGDMRIDLERAVTVLGMLLEGMSIRACERLTGVKRDTICDLVLHVGEQCDRFLRKAVKGVAAKFIELDELWSFVHCKAKTALAKHLEGVGDSWTWLAIDADTKLILAHAVGQRDISTSDAFLSRLNGATLGKTQVTSDGFRTYTHGVPMHLGSRCSFAQLIKVYAASQVETRYSPAVISGIEVIPRFGVPDQDRISTSFAERLNLSVRMHVRRFTRLTNAHSKTVKHHAAMVGLFVAWYNFVRKHETLGKQTPAMAAGLAAERWTIKRMLTEVATCPLD